MGCCDHDLEEMPTIWKNPKVLASLGSGILLLVGFAVLHTAVPPSVTTGLYVISVFLGGFFFGREALEELIHEREIGIEFLMSLAAITAGLMGQWFEASTLVFLYSISEAAEGYTGERTRHAVRALMDLTPKTALVIRGNTQARVPIEELHVNDLFVVLPGEAVATDGEIIEGHSSVNQALITGESIPVEKSVGAKVLAATINGEGALTVRATKTFKENTIARIIELVETAQASKGQSQRLIERFGKKYSPMIVFLGLFIAVIPPLMGGLWETWILRATVFIVAAAPCALVISVPITLVAAIGTASRNGILIKGGIHLENLAKVEVIALDKTGTLTAGRPEVTDIVLFGNHDQKDVLSRAAAIEARSQHPLAQAILNEARLKRIEIKPATQFKSITGSGAYGQVGDSLFYVGNAKLFSTLKLDLTPIQAQVSHLQEEGKTVVLVGNADGIQGLIAIVDPIRQEAAQAIVDLKRGGIKKIVMLTGDNKGTAHSIASRLGIDEVFSELSPEDKTKIVTELEVKYGKVMMVGDGINDSPALAAACVGIAMGAAGTDVALETADVVLMTDDLSKLPYLLRFGRRNWQVIWQNLLLSTLVIGILVVGAVSGVFSLPIAVLAHEISEFVVIASGLRMLRS